MRSERCEPILPSRNLDETRAFYGKLGFTAWFRGHAGCYWRVKDADRFYEECAALNLTAEGIPRLTAPVDEPWGMREFTLVDPSGNLVRVGHDLDADSVPEGD